MQETLLAAWRGLDGFEGASSLRAWLYRIATNRCLNALRDAPRRRGALEPADARADPPADRLAPALPRRAARRHRRTSSGSRRALRDAGRRWAWPSSPGSSTCRRTSARCSCCATCSAIAPPRWRTCSTASEASVNSALQRARAALDSRLPAGRPRAGAAAPLAAERELVARFAEAFQSGDVDAVVALLTDDAWLTMPPAPLELPGPARDRPLPLDGAGRRGARSLPARAH